MAAWPLLRVTFLDDTLNRRGYAFLKTVAAKFSTAESVRSSLPVIVYVDHVYESQLPVINVIHEIGEVVAFIPKHSTKTLYSGIVDALRSTGIKVRGDIAKSSCD